MNGVKKLSCSFTGFVIHTLICMDHVVKLGQRVRLGIDEDGCRIGK